MKLTEKIIKSLSTEEYMERRSEILEFYKNFKQKKSVYDKKLYFNRKQIKNNKFNRKMLADKYKDGRECNYCLFIKTWDKFTNMKSTVCKECKALKSKLRLATDEKFKLIQNLRKRVYNALKGITKSDTTKNLLGCSIEYLKQHLENQFQLGMTWDNYGKWHVDHKKPCCKFDFTKIEQQRECFHYTNLQPLWAIDNLKKSGKYSEKS